MHAFNRFMATTILSTCLGVSAQAEVIKADQAMVVLAKSQAIDVKCNFLTSTEHDELSSLVARAELSLAQKVSVAVASLSLTQGKKAGQASTCDEANRAEVTDILNAAKSAAAQAPNKVQLQTPLIATVAASNTVQPMKAIAVEKPVAVKKIKVASVVKVKEPAARKVQPAKLQTYATITAKYYLERRCGTMGGKAINALYQDVVAIHRTSLNTFGRGAVAAAMHRAEAQASAKSCS
jgi:hypothetical protein